jgi:hypothetical protein
MIMELRPLSPSERNAVESALRQNAQGGDEGALILDPKTTRFVGTGKVDSLAKQIQAIKDVPTHYLRG